MSRTPRIVPVSTDIALVELRAELYLWPGSWNVTGIYPSRSWGSRDDADQWKEGVGSFRRTYGDSWCVEAATDGWEAENETFLAWGGSIAEAALKLAFDMRRRRLDPHSAHIDDGWVMPKCDGCARDVVDLDLVGLPRPLSVR